MGRERLDAELAGPSLWYRLVHLEEVDSTNDEALRQVARGEGPGLVVVADRQTAGRGRRGRVWEDRPGGSIAITLVLPPVQQHRTLVPLLTGVSAVDALRRQGARPELKWPNDVLLADRKCAGILVEHHERAGTSTLLAGIGINLDWRGLAEQDRPQGWTSVAEAAGTEVDRWDVVTDLLRAMASWIRDLDADPARLLASYRTRCATLGQEVSVETADTTISGTARDVDGEGALLVETGGRVARVTVGDVVHLRRPR